MTRAARTVISELGEELLEYVHPAIFRADADINGIIDAVASELELLEETRQTLILELFAHTVQQHIGMFEQILGLPSDITLTMDQRRIRILDYYARVKGSGSGLDWEEDFTRIAGSSASYETNIPGDPSTPPANVIRITLPDLSTSDQANYLRTRLRVVTPANTELQIVYGEGFLLDVDQLDLEPLL